MYVSTASVLEICCCVLTGRSAKWTDALQKRKLLHAASFGNQEEGQASWSIDKAMVKVEFTALYKDKIHPEAVQ